MRHLLSAADLSLADATSILDVAEEMQQVQSRPVKKLPALRGRYDMVNIKLDKTGGLTEALTLAAAAQSQGFTLMLGCMLCTSRAIRMALPLAPQVRFADLDGPTWLAVDAEPSLAFHGGRITL